MLAFVLWNQRFSCSPFLLFPLTRGLFRCPAKGWTPKCRATDAWHDDAGWARRPVGALTTGWRDMASSTSGHLGWPGHEGFGWGSWVETPGAAVVPREALPCQCREGFPSWWVGWFEGSAGVGTERSASHWNSAYSGSGAAFLRDLGGNDHSTESIACDIWRGSMERFSGKDHGVQLESTQLRFGGGSTWGSCLSAVLWRNWKGGCGLYPFSHWELVDWRGRWHFGALWGWCQIQQDCAQRTGVWDQRCSAYMKNIEKAKKNHLLMLPWHLATNNISCIFLYDVIL